jgi:hypothetical protein
MTDRTVEFEGRVKYLEKVHRVLQAPDWSYRAEQMEVENVKQILHDVLNEVHLKTKNADVLQPE